MSVDQFSRGGVENNTHDSVAKSAEMASRGYSGGKTAITLTRLLIIVIIVVITVNQFFIFSMWMEKPGKMKTVNYFNLFKVFNFSITLKFRET